MNVIEALNWRYAVREFSPVRIDVEKIQELLTATRLSATSYGLQTLGCAGIIKIANNINQQNNKGEPQCLLVTMESVLPPRW